MQQQLDEFLSKKPGPRALLIVALILVLLLLCCLCLVTVTANAPTRPTITLTTSPLPDTLTFTITPPFTLTPSITPSITLSPTSSITFTPTLSPTASLTFTPTLTPTPTSTATSTITPTPNPMVGPERLAVYQRTGNVWVTNPDIDQLYELDGTDLHVVSHIQVSSPNGIAIWQRRGLAYVTNRVSNTVTVIDLNVKRIVMTIPVGTAPEGVAVSQDTGDVFVANNQSNSVSCIPVDSTQALMTQSQSLVGPTDLTEGFFDIEIGTPTGNLSPGKRSGATVIDSRGILQIVYLYDPGSGYPLECSLSSIYSRDPTLGKAEFLDDILLIQNIPAYYVSDIPNPKIIMLLLRLNTHVSAGLPHAPSALANLQRCIGAVVPDENHLYLLSYDNKVILKTIPVGVQGSLPGGGQGLAYNPNNDTAYIANRADNTVSRIPHPCP